MRRLTFSLRDQLALKRSRDRFGPCGKKPKGSGRARVADFSVLSRLLPAILPISGDLSSGVWIRSAAV